MRIVVAPDAFKGSASARDVAATLAAGVRDVLPGAVVVERPIADGGEGTIDVFLAAGADARRVRVRGPFGAAREAVYAVRGATAVLEMAAASGLETPTRALADASTYGTGELLRAALDGGATHVILGIGGSATNDGGAGALAALGARFLDVDGAELAPTPAGLAQLAAIDTAELDPRLGDVHLDVACDVTNPLLGPNGATAVYGPQKGAAPSDLAALEAALARFADVAVATVGTDCRTLPGSGAAGGLGFGLATFAGARLTPGFALVAEACDLRGALAGADWCLTGEGRIDASSLHGKVVDGVASLATEAGARVCAFAGSVDPAAEAALGQRGVACLPIVAGPVAVDAAMRDALPLIRAAAARWARLR